MVGTESRGRADERATAGKDAWSTDVEELGRTPAQKITVAIEEPPEGVAPRPELPDGQPVVVRLDVRTIDGENHNITSTYYSISVAEGTPIMHPADVTQGVILLMRSMASTRCGSKWSSAPACPRRTRRQVLEMPAGVAVIVEPNTGYSKERPVK